MLNGSSPTDRTGRACAMEIYISFDNCLNFLMIVATPHTVPLGTVYVIDNNRPLWSSYYASLLNARTLVNSQQ